jgi:hypothetical protein
MSTTQLVLLPGTPRLQDFAACWALETFSDTDVTCLSQPEGAQPAPAPIGVTAISVMGGRQTFHDIADETVFAIVVAHLHAVGAIDHEQRDRLRPIIELVEAYARADDAPSFLDARGPVAVWLLSRGMKASHADTLRELMGKAFDAAWADEQARFAPTKQDQDAVEPTCGYDWFATVPGSTPPTPRVVSSLSGRLAIIAVDMPTAGERAAQFDEGARVILRIGLTGLALWWRTTEDRTVAAFARVWLAREQQLSGAGHASWSVGDAYAYLGAPSHADVGMAVQLAVFIANAPLDKLPAAIASAELAATGSTTATEEPR